jgi:hypothetical protein
MQAKELIKWAEVSVILTGNKNTVRPNRKNKKYTDEIQGLLDFVQEWIDKKGNVTKAVVTVKVPEKAADSKKESVPAVVSVIETVKNNDYISVDALPSDRKIYTEGNYRGLYSSGKKFYTNKVKDGTLDIREWSKIEKAKKYLDSLK